MSKVVVSQFVSVDGVIEDPGGSEGVDRGGWAFQFERGPEGDKFKVDEVMQADALLLGRVTYEEFAAYWPTADPDDPFAAYINNTPKVVVSNSLTSADWQNSSIISGDVNGQLRALKEQDGKNIGMTGSITLVRSLLRDGLLDELRLQVYPIVVGSGKRLFEESIGLLPMKLLKSTTTANGVAILHYQPAP